MVTHSKSCAPCLGFKDLHQRMGNLPFHLNLSPLPPVPQVWLDPKDFCLLPDVFCTLVQFSLSHIQLFSISWGARDGQVSLSIINSQRFLRLMFIRSVMPPNNFIFCLPTLPSAFNLSLHQGLFWWVSSSHQLAKVLEFQLQYQSFQWVFRAYFLLRLTSLISLWSKGLSRVFSSSTVSKASILLAQPSLWFNFHIHTWLLEKP